MIPVSTSAARALHFPLLFALAQMYGLFFRWLCNLNIFTGADAAWIFLLEITLF